MRRRRELVEELEALRQELDVLRAENARLRLQQQTATSLGGAPERVRAVLAERADGVDDRDDSAAAVLAEAALVRSSVVAVCEELQTTFAQLQRRLESAAPAPELDRRVRTRGDVDDDGADNGRQGHG